MRPKAVLGLARPFTMLAPVLGVACGSVAASARMHAPWPAGLVALAALSALLVNGASNAWNQAFDAEIDRVNKPGRPIPSGLATPRAALWLGHAFAAAGLLAGAGHAAAAGHAGFLLCVGVGAFATWAYSAPPLRTKRHPLAANLTIALPRGFLVPVAGWAAATMPSGIEPWALGLVPGLFVLGAASTKDFADVEGDRAHGCRTWPVLLGPARAARLVAPFLFFPFLLYAPLAAAGAILPAVLPWLAVSLLLALGGAATARALLSDPARLATERNHPAWRGMYLLMVANTVATALVYALSA